MRCSKKDVEYVEYDPRLSRHVLVFICALPGRLQLGRVTSFLDCRIRGSDHSKKAPSHLFRRVVTGHKLSLVLIW